MVLGLKCCKCNKLDYPFSSVPYVSYISNISIYRMYLYLIKNNLTFHVMRDMIPIDL